MNDECGTCKGAEWVCEQHPTQPWSGMSVDTAACPEGCIGPRMHCVCKTQHDAHAQNTADEHERMRFAAWARGRGSWRGSD